MPPLPVGIGRAALCARVCMVVLAVAWCSSLAVDAALGRAAWTSPVMGALLLVGWAAVCWVGRGARAGVLATADPVSTLYWQDATASWQDAAGSPVKPRLIFDLGRFCLLQLSSVGGSATSGRVSYHWIDASPEAGHLQGSWRWRVMMASSRSSTSPTTALPNSLPRTTGRPA